MSAIVDQPVGEIELTEMSAFEFDTPCSFEGCKEAATWYLLCPYDRSAEPCCSTHKEQTAGWPDDLQIIFNESCGHAPDIGSCLWEPIK